MIRGPWRMIVAVEGSGGSRIFLAITLALFLILSLLVGVWFMVRQRGGLASLPGNSSDTPRASAKTKNRLLLLVWSGVVAACAVALGVFLATWLLWPTPADPAALLNATLGGTPVAEVEESGFSYQEYDKEIPFRWTDGHGRLVIPIDRSKLPQALFVEIFVYRPPGVAGWIRLVANQQVLFHEHLSHYRFRRILDLRGIDLGDKLVLDIISDTFQPQGVMDNGTNNDPRTLGVQVRAIKLLATLGEKAASPQEPH